MTVLQVIVYAFTLWMGAYLLERGRGAAGVRYAGAGLVGYAAALGTVTAGAVWGAWLVVPALPLWALALTHLRRAAADVRRSRRALVLGYLGAVFFTLTLSLVAVPPAWLERSDLLVALSIDVVLMGYALIWLHTVVVGESLLPDAVRSLLLASGGAVLFGGQVALILLLDGAASSVVRGVLLGVVGSVVLVTVYGRRVGRLLDRLLLSPELAASRAELEQTADEMGRKNPAYDLLQADEDEFARLTRRALGDMNTPGRLVASPLMNLPMIDTHSATSGDVDTALDRANVLRLLLAEQIEKLRPLDEDARGVTEPWRYYNALHIPYVAGVKPYSTRLSLSDLDDETREVVEWMRVHVPQRTLYNWQTAAAHIIAADLREQLHRTNS